MISRALVLGWVLLVALGVTGVAGAGVQAGPRLAFLKTTERPNALLVATSDAALREQETVAGGGADIRPLPYPLSGPAWSPDGSLIAFSGMAESVVARLLRPEHRQIYLVGADGGRAHAVPGTRGGFAPVFSPDGKTIAFARTRLGYRQLLGGLSLKSIAVWNVGLDGTGLRQLTAWANGVEDLPSSFSPDGSLLGITHRDVIRDRADAVTLRLDGGGSHVLSASAAWPRYSPDGTQIAFLGIDRIGDTSCCELGDGFSVDLYAMNADRSSRQLLTDTPSQAERPASWDPSGERLVFTTKSAPTARASGDLEAAVMQINADGTCRSRISIPVPKARGHSVSFHYPTWQPGLGRGAGPIAC